MKDYSIQKKYYPSQNYNGFEPNSNHQYKYYTPNTNKRNSINQSETTINFNKQRYQPLINKNSTPFKTQGIHHFQNNNFQSKYFAVADYSKEHNQSSNQKNMIFNLRQQLNSLKSQVNKLIQKDPQSASKAQFNFSNQLNNLKDNCQPGRLTYLNQNTKIYDQETLRRQSQPIQNQSMAVQHRQSIHTTKPNFIMNKATLQRADSLREQNKNTQRSVINFQKRNQFVQINRRDFQNSKQPLEKKQSIPNNFRQDQNSYLLINKKIKQCVNCLQSSKQILFLKEKLEKNSLPDNFLQQIQHQQAKMKNLIQNSQYKNTHLQNINKNLSEEVKQLQEKNKQLKQANSIIISQLQDAKRMIQQVRLSVGLKNSLLDKFQAQIDQLKMGKMSLQCKLSQLKSKESLFTSQNVEFQRLKQKVTQLQNDERRLLRDAEYWKSQYQQTSNKFNLIRVQIKNLQKSKQINQQQLEAIKVSYRNSLQNQAKGKSQSQNKDQLVIQNQFNFQKQPFQLNRQKQRQTSLMQEVVHLKQTIQTLQAQVKRLKHQNRQLMKKSKALSKEQKAILQQQIRQGFNQKQKIIQNQIVLKDKLIHNLYKDLQHFQNQLKLNLCLKNNYEVLINELNQKQIQRRASFINKRLQGQEQNEQSFIKLL